MRDHPTKSGSLPIIILSLLGLSFAAIGGFLLWLAVSTFLESKEMSTWPTVPARIEYAKLETHVSHDSDGRSETYSVASRYTYEYAGNRYSGTRVTPFSGSDSARSFHEGVFWELDKHRREGTLFNTYVNPSHPEESILYPQLRIGMLVGYLVAGGVFVAVGLPLLVLPLFTRKANATLTPVAPTSQSLGFAALPVKPWETREEWKTGVIHSSSKGGFIAIGIFSLLWLVASSGAAASAWEQLPSLSAASLIGLIFPAIGVLFLLTSIRMFLHWRTYGVSTLRLSNVPVEPGGELKGEIEVTVPFQPGLQVAMELVCSRLTKTGTGKNRRAHKSEVWSKKWSVVPRSTGGRRGSRIPVSCEIPANALESSDFGGITWDLTASAAVRGVDFAATFEVPVFPANPETEEE